jgi:two-component system phosphate regulon sensor histidine kinase PhoR
VNLRSRDGQLPAAWIVDDSPLELERARRALGSDYRVMTFDDASRFLEHLAANQAPDVLVLDWVMPGITGIEVCQFLRAQPATQELAILLLTSMQETAQIVLGLAAGANDYLKKPYAPEELVARVAALVRAQELGHRAARAERALRSVLTDLPDAVIIVDGKGLIAFVNTQAQRVLGASFAELVGNPLNAWLPQLSLERLEPAGFQASLPDLVLGERIFSPRVSVPPWDGGGNTTVVLRDMTETRDLEARRLDFYSVVAHDLRSPLHAMKMRAEVVLKGMRGELPPAVRMEMEKITGRMNDMTALINDFLEIARIDSAGLRLERKDTALGALLHDVADELRLLADSRQIQLTIQADDHTQAFVDRRRMEQVLVNLLSNAIKFTSPGGSVSMVAKTRNDAIEVVVTDTGPGIDAAVIPRLFQRYERAPGASGVAGTGLGLMIVREIVEAHGGSVGVESEPGRGSSFSLLLPKQRMNEACA